MAFGPLSFNVMRHCVRHARMRSTAAIEGCADGCSGKVRAALVSSRSPFSVVPSLSQTLSPTRSPSSVSRRNPFGAHRTSVIRKKDRRRQKSGYGDGASRTASSAVGPWPSADKPPEGVFPVRAEGFRSETFVGALTSPGVAQTSPPACGVGFRSEIFAGCAAVDQRRSGRSAVWMPGAIASAILL